MLLKNFVASIIVVASCGFALSAHAAKLTIVNNTAFDSTTRIHNVLNKCSSELLGEAGITRAGKTNDVSEGNIKTACWFTPNECVADVYATDNCSGEIVATMVFSTTKGVQSITPRTPIFTIQAATNSFHVTLNPVA